MGGRYTVWGGHQEANRDANGHHFDFLSSYAFFTSELKIKIPSKRKAKQQLLTELNWVYRNLDSFNHTKSFDFFQSYDRPTASRRFKYIVANFISDVNKRNEILENYNTWKRKKEARLYWDQREKQRNDNFMNNFGAMDEPVLLAESTSTNLFDESNSTTTTAIISMDIMDSSNTSTLITDKSDHIDIDQAKILISEALRAPDEDDCYMIGNMNVSTCFFGFQTFVQSLLNDRLLNFESYLQHILSLSSILLVGKNRVQPDLLKSLENGTEDDSINDVHKKIKMNENKFPRLLLMEVLDIVQDVYQKKITRIEATHLFLDLTDDQSDLVIRIILCFKRLVEDLPDELLTSTIKELGLCTSFLQPALKPLFDNPEKKCSSRYIDKENVQHSQDDTIKIIHASLELLDSLIRRHLSASFSSLCLIKSFSVQCVCTSITLSTTSLDPEDPGAYIHTHVRSADIPLNYDSRASWTAIFELLAYLFTCLKEQKLVLETVTKESTVVEQ
ncbi:hypothetical protein G6F36_013081 [Rhizopus arrhizus]|nr:hypothetical protein G6F36_013081 [Rhizopus arrhizus]